MRKDIQAINEAFRKVISEGRGTLRAGDLIDQLKSIINLPDNKLTDVTNVSIRLSDQREIFDRFPKIYPYVKEMFTAVMSENGAAKTKEIAKQAIAAIQKFYPNADKYQRANPKFSEDAEERSFEAVLDDVMALYQKGHIKDESQAIDILTAELGRDLTPQEEQEVTGYFDGTDMYMKDAWSSEDAEDIEPTPADPNASWNPRDWNNEPSDNKSMTNTEEAKHDKAFYTFWEDIVDRMSDDVLESTLYMIKNFDALNALIKEEHGYRTQSFEA